MTKLNLNPNILVIGGGASGILSAYKVSNYNFPVWLIDQNEGFNIDPCFKEYQSYYEEILKKLKNTHNVFFLENAEIIKVKGTAGNFEVILNVKGEIQKHIFGSIVVATPYKLNPIFEEFNLSSSDNILTLSELEKKIEKFKDPSGQVFLFLTKFEDESNPVTFKRILMDSLDLLNLKAKVYVVTKNVKVAASGLEKLTYEAKKKGVIIIKTTQKPQVTVEDTVKVSVVDSVINEKVEIFANFVVLEDEILPNKSNQSLSEILSLHTDRTGFLQTNNVRRSPVYTNRKGIFVSGSGSGIKPFYQVVMDSINVAYEVRALLKKEEVSDTISVDDNKCVCCLTCYRVCPHGAISWDRERIVISSLACEGCGICAAECPMNAIQLKIYPDDYIKSQIYESIGSTSARPLIIGFFCKNSAYEAFKGAEKFGYDIPLGLKPIKVPCAGKVDMDYILEALARGADGVLIGACYNGNCKSEKGNTFAGYRIEQIRNFLNSLGIDADKVFMINVASNMPKEFSLKVKELEEKLLK